MSSITIKYARVAAPWLVLGLHVSGCSGPSIHRPSPNSPASVRAQEAPLPPIATSITRDPLDASTLKQPASNEGSGTMSDQGHGAGHVH
jgi:hypothetical protein